MYNHKSSFHFSFSILQIGGKISIDQESVESNPAKSRHISESISAEASGNLARIRHQRYVDSLCNALVDHSYNRNHGIQRNWKLLPDLTTAYPSYGMEVQEAQAR